MDLDSNNDYNNSHSKPKPRKTERSPFQRNNYFAVLKNLREKNTHLLSQNSNKKTQPKFIEDLYLKYSSNLENYFTQNKTHITLYGSKIYENESIDTFLQQVKENKDKLLQKLRSRGLCYVSPGKNRASNEKIILTPLPNKSRKNLVSTKEKEDFFNAERSAVVMRTVEYTHAVKAESGTKTATPDKDRKNGVKIIQIRNKTSTERNYTTNDTDNNTQMNAQMANLLKKPVDVIQTWWLAMKKRKGSKKSIYLKKKRNNQGMDKNGNNNMKPLSQKDNQANRISEFSLNEDENKLTSSLKNALTQKNNKCISIGLSLFSQLMTKKQSLIKKNIYEVLKDRYYVKRKKKKVGSTPNINTSKIITKNANILLKSTIRKKSTILPCIIYKEQILFEQKNDDIKKIILIQKKLKSIFQLENQKKTRNLILSSITTNNHQDKLATSNEKDEEDELKLLSNPQRKDSNNKNFVIENAYNEVIQSEPFLQKYVKNDINKLKESLKSVKSFQCQNVYGDEILGIAKENPKQADYSVDNVIGDEILGKEAGHDNINNSSSVHDNLNELLYQNVIKTNKNDKPPSEKFQNYEVENVVDEEITSINYSKSIKLNESIPINNYIVTQSLPGKEGKVYQIQRLCDNEIKKDSSYQNEIPKQYERSENENDDDEEKQFNSLKHLSSLNFLKAKENINDSENKIEEKENEKANQTGNNENNDNNENKKKEVKEESDKEEKEEDEKEEEKEVNDIKKDGLKDKKEEEKDNKEDEEKEDEIDIPNDIFSKNKAKGRENSQFNESQKENNSENNKSQGENNNMEENEDSDNNQYSKNNEVNSDIVNSSLYKSTKSQKIIGEVFETRKNIYQKLVEIQNNENHQTQNENEHEKTFNNENESEHIRNKNSQDKEEEEEKSTIIKSELDNYINTYTNIITERNRNMKNTNEKEYEKQNNNINHKLSKSAQISKYNFRNEAHKNTINRFKTYQEHELGETKTKKINYSVNDTISQKEHEEPQWEEMSVESQVFKRPENIKETGQKSALPNSESEMKSPSQSKSNIYSKQHSSLLKNGSHYLAISHLSEPNNSQDQSRGSDQLAKEKNQNMDNKGKCIYNNKGKIIKGCIQGRKKEDQLAREENNDKKARESYNNKNNLDDGDTLSKCNSLLQSNLINADSSQQFSLKSFNNNEGKNYTIENPFYNEKSEQKPIFSIERAYNEGIGEKHFGTAKLSIQQGYQLSYSEQKTKQSLHNDDSEDKSRSQENDSKLLSNSQMRNSTKYLQKINYHLHYYYTKLLYINNKEIFSKVNFIQSQYKNELKLKNRLMKRKSLTLDSNQIMKKPQLLSFYSFSSYYISKIRRYENNPLDNYTETLLNDNLSKINYNEITDKSINTEISPFCMVKNKSFDVLPQPKNQRENKIIENKTSRSILSQKSPVKLDLSPSKSDDETAFSSCLASRKNILKRILHTKNKIMENEMRQTEKNITINVSKINNLKNFTKKKFITVLRNVLLDFLRRIFYRIVRHDKKKHKIVKILILKHSTILRIFFEFWKNRNGTLKVYAKKKITELSHTVVITRNKLNHLINAISSIATKDFFYRLVLLYLFKSGVDINYNSIVSFLKKGFSYGYLFTLGNALKLNLTRNFFSIDHKRSFLEYMKKIDELNTQDNTDTLKLNNCYFTIQTLPNKKEKTLNKTFDEEKKILLSDDEKTISDDGNRSKYSCQTHQNDKQTILVKKILLKK